MTWSVTETSVHDVDASYTEIVYSDDPDCQSDEPSACNWIVPGTIVEDGYD